MTRYHLTLKSENPKTGPIPVSTTSSDTCPRTCGMFDACYAKASFPSRLHWGKVDCGERGTGLRGFLAAVRMLTPGTLWRHNQAGDLPGRDGAIDPRALDGIVKANKGKHGFTYTHKPMTPDNVKLVRRANRAGFVINLSADNPAMADQLARLNAGPVVTVLNAGVCGNQRTPEGRLIVICPAVSHKESGVTCSTCKLCAWSERKVIIGFPAHGVRKGLVQIG